MPAVTRSCTKQKGQKGRSRIEDETPVSSNARRYATRSTAAKQPAAKRKIISQESDNKDVEPPSKRAVRSKVSSKNVPKSCKISSMKAGDEPQKVKGCNTKSRPQASKIPKRCVKDNKTADVPPPGKKTAHKACARDVDKENTVVDQSGISSWTETVPKTPAGCIAARIRSYSALRRSQKKKNHKHDGSLANKGKKSSSNNASSPLGEINFNSMETELHNNGVGCEQEEETENCAGSVIDSDGDDDILWRMGRCRDAEMEDKMSPAKTDEESSYKRKYFMMVSAMKQLQNNFIKSQQNVERNVKAYDKFVNNLKTNLNLEKQKSTLLSEELKIKKGAVERLRTDLVNTKEQLNILQEEKDDVEKQDRKEPEKMIGLDEVALRKNESEKKKIIEDQKAVINLYSKLSGVVVSRDSTCEDESLFQSFNCNFHLKALSNHCLQFRLTHDKEFDEIEYSPNPKSPGSEEVLQSLPKCLKENIFFGSDHAPNFLAKLLATVKENS